jgi:uncharacterized membrane protein
MGATLTGSSLAAFHFPTQKGRTSMAEEQITDNDKLFAALSYIFWPVAVIVLLSETNKNRPFQRHHAIQALSYGVAAFILLSGFICIDFVVGQISGALGTIFACITFPVWLIPFAIALWFAYRAYQGELFEIPYVTDFVRSQGWL